MNKKSMQIFKLTGLAAALLAAYGPALAEDGAESSVSVGIGNWNQDRPQAGGFDGMRDSGTYGLFDADILRRDDATGTWLGLKARNLGLDSREIKGEWQRQGDIGASLEYSRIPRDNPFNFNTGVQGIGTTTLRVPTPSIAPGSGTNVELGTVRDRYTAKFFKNLGVGLNFNVSFRNEDKDGTRAWGRGGAAEFAVEPINSTTRQLEAILSYARDKYQLSGGYYGTTYDNANSLVTTSLTNNASIFYLSLPMDNKSHEVFLNGGYNFTPTTRGTFKASYSQATQNEYLPTAGIAGLAAAFAPQSLNGRLDTTLLEAGITAKPMPKLSIVGNLRYRDFADKTPLQNITATVWNTPFSYTNKVGKLEATYRLTDGYSLLGGVEYNAQDRSVPSVGTLWVPFRATLNEQTYRVQLRKSMSETVNGTLAYAHSRRDGGALTLPPGDGFREKTNPLNIADRNRDKLRAMLDWAPLERLTLQFAMEGSHDNYGGPNPYGLQDGRAQLYTVDGSYQLTSDWVLTAWVSRDDTRATEITQNTTANKYTSLREVGTSFGLGLRGNVGTNLKLGANAEQFRSVNEYRQGLSAGTLPAGTTTVPDINNKMVRVTMFAQYAVQKNADVRLNVIHERWNTDDWSWMMFPASGATPFVYGTATDGTSVTSNPRQNATFIGARYIYRFH